MREVKFWALAAPVRADNGITYTSFTSGKEGIKRVLVADSGLVIAEREDADTLMVFGLAWGYLASTPIEVSDSRCGGQLTSIRDCAPAPSVLETPKAPETFTCDVCSGEFATKGALAGHKLHKHKEL